MDYEISPLSESESESLIVPYSHMTEEDAELAYSTRKQQIKAMLKARSTFQTPDSADSKYTVSSTKSKKSNQPSKNISIRFSAEAEKISKHSIDLSLKSQQELKERLKNQNPVNVVVQTKYNVAEPLYKRTVE